MFMRPLWPHSRSDSAAPLLPDSEDKSDLKHRVNQNALAGLWGSVCCTLSTKRLSVLHFLVLLVWISCSLLWLEVRLRRLSDVGTDYYAQPGSLVINSDRSAPAAAKARYVAISALNRITRDDQACSPGFDLDDGYAGVMQLSRPHDTSLPDYLRGKSVVLLGDSIDRIFVDHFCKKLTTRGKLSIHALHIAPRDLSVVRHPDSFYDDFSEPHSCTVTDEHGSFRIWSLMHYGTLTDDEHEWSFKNQTRGPRVAHEKVALFANALRAAGHPPPDLVVAHSG